MALAMASEFTFDGGFEPPSLSPRPPPFAHSPPPPPPPPRPRLPRAEESRIYYQSPSSVKLSTYSIGEPATDPDGVSSALGNHLMALTDVDNATRDAALIALTEKPYTRWAACTDSLRHSPLACRTGDTVERCISGMRHCDTLNENTYRPWLQLDLHDTQIEGDDKYNANMPSGPPFYFFGLRLRLPADPDHARLFFGSSEDGPGGSGYVVSIYDESHTPLSSCKDHTQQVVDGYSPGLRDVDIVCSNAIISDAEITQLEKVRYVRISLIGAYRMLWLESISVIWRTLGDLPPSSPPPPVAPSPPPAPLAPPDAPLEAPGNCTLYPDLVFVPGVLDVVVREPCGLTSDACCDHLKNYNQTGVGVAFELTGSGCCTLMGSANDLFGDALIAVANGSLVPDKNSSIVAVTGVLV